jgi:xanthine dehydrogenase accessory factor
MNGWLDDLRGLRDSDDCSVVTIVGVRGSAPREIGAKMIVTGKETIGTIGGGQLEYQCTRIGVKQMQKDGAYRGRRLHRRFPLGANCGQCCGGVVDVMFERIAVSKTDWIRELQRLHDERRPVVMISPLDESAGRYLVTGDRCVHFERVVACPDEVVAAARQLIIDQGSAIVLDDFILEPIMQSDFQVAVFGAGHVGAATVDILSRLECNIRWIDSRRNIFPARLPDNVTTVESATPAQEVAALPEDTNFLVMTHSHPLDFEICDRILRRGDFAYCGLIGSLSKRRRFEREMRKQALPDTLLDRLTCPIGVDGISSKKPADIAIAVAAELLRVRDAAGEVKMDNDALPDNVHIL